MDMRNLKFEDNSFIKLKKEELAEYKKQAKKLVMKFRSSKV